MYVRARKGGITGFFALLGAESAWRLDTLWALIGQLAATGGYAFVFGGLLGLMGGLFSYLPFLIVGLGPWFYYEKALTAALSAPTRLKPLLYLCNPGILSAAAVLGALPWHILWLGLGLGAAAVAGGLTPAALFAPYYLLCGVLNALGQGILGAALVPLMGDAVRGAMAALTVVFWTTPVIWPLTLMPPLAVGLLKINPLYYVTEGMRGCLLYGRPFLPLGDTLWFFGITLGAAALGLFCTVRLRSKYWEGQ